MLNIPIHRRLGFRIISLFSVIMLIGSLIGLFGTRYLAERDFYSLMYQQFRMTANMAENSFTQIGQMGLNEVHHFLLNPALHKAIDTQDNQAIVKQMDKLIAEINADTAVLLDQRGRILYHSEDPEQLGKSSMSHHIVREAILDGKNGISILQELDNFIIYSSGRILNHDKQSNNFGNLKAIVLIGFAINDSLIKNLSKNTEVGITLVRRRAIMASTFNQDNRRLKNIPMQWVKYQIMLRRHDLINKMLFNNISYFTHAHRLALMDPMQEGSILFTIPSKRLDDNNNMLLQEFTLLFSLQFILITLLGWRFSKHLLNPLHRLLLFTANHNQQQVQSFPPINRQDEVGVLARYFCELINDVKKKNQELEQRDKLKDEFLANTSYELRTPLNEMIGIAESLLDDGAGELNILAQTNLSMIVNSGKRLSILVNDTLDLSKLKHKELELELKPIGLREIIDVLVLLNQPLVRKKPIQLNHTVTEDLPAVYADENRLQQILHNLISNAIKFTSQGKIEISAQLIQNEWLEITVADTGVGIAENKLATIFQSFEPTDNSIEYGGISLGLTVTEKLVELHGGKIWVISQIDVGSQFIFTLPVAKSLASQPQLTQTLLLEKSVDVIIPAQDKISFTILIVDDEQVNIQIIINYLASQNYNIIQADSGLKACKLIAEGLKPDLVLLDVIMPGMTGYEVARKIRQQFLINELPILMLTVNDQSSNLIAGLEVGVNDYLTKPISKDELLTRVKTHLHLQHLNKAYSRFVPHEFLSFLNKESIIDINLGDQVEKEMTILFSDIRNFTSISEKLTPEDNFDFINTYLGQMEPVILKYQGIIDKYIGDAIMVLFPTNADDALKGAIAMLEALAKYNQILQYTEFDIMRIGIGLHTGKLILGTIGGQSRMDSTVISDAVNLASRVEGLTKTYNTPLLITEITYQQLTDQSQYKIRVIDRVTVKGKTKPVTIYEVFDNQEPAQIKLKLTTLANFELGFKYFHNGQFELSQQAFEKVLQLNKDDKVAQIYIEKCHKILGSIMPKKPLILIVDDTPANLNLLSDILKKCNFEILIVESGKEALETVAQKNPHLVLLDIMMQGMDGFEVCQQLKENPKTRDIPIIFMTSSSEQEDKIKGFKLGAVDYITKPFQTNEVLSRIRTHLKLHFLQQQFQVRNMELETQNKQLKEKMLL
ncbi:MAG: response regulator [Candidatus Marithrix sp.]|nr:response regulator [Candidatus Marithrix sp.]